MWSHVADNRFHLASAELPGRGGHWSLCADAPPDGVSGERAAGRRRARVRQEMKVGRLDIPRSRPGPGVGDACLRGSTCERGASPGVSKTSSGSGAEGRGMWSLSNACHMSASRTRLCSNLTRHRGNSGQPKNVEPSWRFVRITMSRSWTALDSAGYAGLGGIRNLASRAGI